MNIFDLACKLEKEIDKYYNMNLNQVFLFPEEGYCQEIYFYDYCQYFWVLDLLEGLRILVQMKNQDLNFL